MPWPFGEPEGDESSRSIAGAHIRYTCRVCRSGGQLWQPLSKRHRRGDARCLPSLNQSWLTLILRRWPWDATDARNRTWETQARRAIGPWRSASSRNAVIVTRGRAAPRYQHLGNRCWRSHVDDRACASGRDRTRACQGGSPVLHFSTTNVEGDATSAASIDGSFATSAPLRFIIGGADVFVITLFAMRIIHAKAVADCL